MMKIKILKGLPASGKTTWARNFVDKNKDWIRINRDDLRNMRGTYWIPKQENLITDMENACIYSALSRNFNVILDSTNLNMDRNRSRVDKIREKFPDLNVEYKNFNTSLEECIRRDLKRSNSIGERVIKAMHDKYLKKEITYREDESLPRCVIFDVDGTLAKMNGRGPYEWDRVKEDKVNIPIASLCKKLAEDKKIIIFTGRDGVCESLTKEWLRENDIPFDEFYIRPKNNTEKDSVIKNRMFEENIRGKYFCEMVVDDRDQVVDMWRNEIGLTCLQVDYGNF